MNKAVRKIQSFVKPTHLIAIMALVLAISLPWFFKASISSAEGNPYLNTWLTVYDNVVMNGGKSGNICNNIQHFDPSYDVLSGTASSVTLPSNNQSIFCPSVNTGNKTREMETGESITLDLKIPGNVSGGNDWYVEIQYFAEEDTKMRVDIGNYGGGEYDVYYTNASGESQILNDNDPIKVNAAGFYPITLTNTGAGTILLNAVYILNRNVSMPDLSIQKELYVNGVKVADGGRVDYANMPANKQVTYKLNWESNDGTVPFGGIEVTDSFDRNDYVFVDTGGDFVTKDISDVHHGNVKWLVKTDASDTSGTITLTLQAVDPNVAGSLNGAGGKEYTTRNTAKIDFVDDFMPAVSSKHDVTYFVPAVVTGPELSITKTVSPALQSFVAGTNPNNIYFDYVITLNNTGDTTATNVQVIDMLPSYISNVQNVTPSSSSSSNLRINWGGITIAGGGIWTASFRANVDTSNARFATAGDTTLTNQIRVSDSLDTVTYDTDQVNSTVRVTSPGALTLDIVKTVSPSTQSFVAGTNPNNIYFDYNITLTNTSNITATNVKVIDTLPSYIANIASAIPATTTSTNQRIVWSGLNVQAHATWTASFRANVDTSNAHFATAGDTTLTNTVEVKNADESIVYGSDLVNSTVRATTTGTLTLDIEKNVSPSRQSFDLGTNPNNIYFDYVITLENTSNVDATNLNINDALPSYISNVQSITPVATSSSNHRIDWDGINLSQGHTWTASFRAYVDTNDSHFASVGDTTLTNEVEVRDSTEATLYDSDSVNSTVRVTNPTALALDINKTASVASLLNGDTVIYTVTVDKSDDDDIDFRIIDTISATGYISAGEGRLDYTDNYTQDVPSGVTVSGAINQPAGLLVQGMTNGQRFTFTYTASPNGVTDNTTINNDAVAQDMSGNNIDTSRASINVTSSTITSSLGYSRSSSRRRHSPYTPYEPQFIATEEQFSIYKDVNPKVASNGNEVTYEIIVTNLGETYATTLLIDGIGLNNQAFLSGDNGAKVTYVKGSLNVVGATFVGDVANDSGLRLVDIAPRGVVRITYKGFATVPLNTSGVVRNTATVQDGGTSSAEVNVKGDTNVIPPVNPPPEKLVKVGNTIFLMMLSVVVMALGIIKYIRSKRNKLLFR